MAPSLLNIYWVAFKTSLLLQFQYRAAMAIWMIWRILEPIIYLIVWSTVAVARGGEVGGFRPGDFVAYYIVLMFVNQFTFTWIMYEFEWRIRSGSLSPLLLKPIHPIHQDVADNIAYKFLTSVILLPTIVVLVLLFDPTVDISIQNAILFFPALLIAFFMRFFVEWSLAIVAFWTVRTAAINQMYFVLGLFLSGRIAPLALLPEWVQVIADILPFRWAVAFPVELLLGHLSQQQIWSGFGAQLCWLGLSLVILSQMWRIGVRRYSAVGS